MESTKGIAYVTMNLAPDATSRDIAEWYQEKYKLGGYLHHSSSGSCYVATDLDTTGKGKMKWMAIQEIDDMAEMAQALGTERTQLEGPRPDYQERYFELQESHESEGFKDLKLNPSTEPNFVVAVCIRLHPGRKVDFDRYYSEEHMDALKKVPGWRRTRRFVTAALEEGDPDEVECLALHDYAPDNGLGGENFKAATTTAWYKDMMSNAVKHKTRRTYDLCYASAASN